MTTNFVFDFGAVLFAWRPDLIVAQSFPELAPTPQASRELAGDIFHHQDWQQFDRGALELSAVIARTAERTGLPHGQMQALMTGIPQRLEPISETIELLERLQQRREQLGDVRLLFLSNMPAPFARVLEQRHAFLDWFDGGVFSGDVRLAKPQSEIYALMESRYALEPTQTVFIDDLPANVDAARARGWRGILFESASQLAPHLELTPK